MHGPVSVFGAQTHRSVLLRALVLAAVMSRSGAALAGGFEIPDNGAEAMGRGAAYVAKASDGTAIYHNPAGLARQRGTHALVNGNIFLHSFEFQRIGAYPDDPADEATPWGGQKYPVAKNTAGPLFKPLFAVTTDFGYFDRFTVGAGLFSPSTVSNRTFPIFTGGKPSSSRYDFVQSRSSLLYPTLSGGFRLTSWLDLGVSLHLVLASFDETRVAYADFGSERCRENEQDGQKLKEDFRCDSRSTLEASATSVAATFGAMARPTPSVAFGLSFRTPTNIEASGILAPTAPPLVQPAGEELKPGAATYALQLPWAVRAGGRYIGMDADFELYDLELDVAYEGWGSAQGLGPILTVPDIGGFKDIQAVVQHGYGNTFGVRGGGAYNIDTGDGILSLRGGAYFDSSATDFKSTRLDFDTLAKVAGTFGLGYTYGSVGFDLAYAAVASVPRTVGSGDGGIRPVNDRAGGRTDGADDAPLPAVNEGAYAGFTHIIALGVRLSIDRFLGPPRPIRYGNPYEPGYVGPEEKIDDTHADTKASDEAKTDDRKADDRKADDRKADDRKADEPEAKPEKRSPPDDDAAPLVPSDREDEDVVAPTKPAPPPPVKPPTRRKEWWEEPE